MEIGDKFTQGEFDHVKKGYKKYSFGGDYYIFDDDLRFEKYTDDTGETMWMLVSTFDSRVANQDNGPKIHRKESKKFKSYYDNRKH